MVSALLVPGASNAAVPQRAFLAAEASASGTSREALNLLVAEGRVRRLLHEVYAPADLPNTLDLRVQAASLVLPEHAVVVDKSAAWLWGADVHDPDDLGSVPRLEVFVRRGYKRVIRPELGGGERDLSGRDIVTVGEVQVTTPVRTAMDLGCRLSPPAALAAMDALAHRQGVTVFDLMAELPRFRGRRGVVQLRRLVPLVEPRTESSGESFTRYAIIDRNLPRPEAQVWVNVAGVPTFRLDLAYRRLKIAVEYDGEEFHTSPEDRDGDGRRRAWLRRNGWHVIVVDKHSLSGPARDAWLSELIAVLRERGA